MIYSRINIDMKASANQIIAIQNRRTILHLPGVLELTPESFSTIGVERSTTSEGLEDFRLQLDGLFAGSPNLCPGENILI